VKTDDRTKRNELPARGGETIAVPRFRVSVVMGANVGAHVDSDGERLDIGSHAGNHLVLSDSTVSRHHASITIGPRGAQIRDLGSLNHTRLAGFRIESAFLDDGALITIGQTTLRFQWLQEEARHAVSDSYWFGDVLGVSPAIRRSFAVLSQVSHTDATVLIEGETGTGKTVIAEAVHRQSRRTDGPFIVVDCGALPPRLIETELFGHEKGAFTGAIASREGAFEAARGGTIFFDEIGELPLDVQPKLLRALDKKVITRVGSTEMVPVDVRVIAATNRDLRHEMNRGRFRADLFYRLGVVSVRVPSLAERAEDVPVLAQRFWEELAGLGSSIPSKLLASFTAREWPGNVRELRNAVERAYLLAGEPGEEDLSRVTVERRALNDSAEDEQSTFRGAKEAAITRWEKGYLAELMRASEGNISKAARVARMDRNYLRDLLRRHQMASPGGGGGE
jgi:DNA-binding NtrC family response regulator